MQLQDIHISHRHLAVEAVAGAAVVKIDLTRRIKPGAFEHRRHVALARAVEHRGAERDAPRQMPGHLDDLLAAARLDVARIFVAIGFDQLLAHRLGSSEEHTSELPSLMRISYSVFCLKK